MSRASLLTAILLLLSSTASAQLPRPVADAVGVVWDSTQDKTFGFSRGLNDNAIQFQAVPTGTAIDIFLIFYDSDGVAWSASEKAYAASLFSSAGLGSSLTHLLAQYPDMHTNSVDAPITLHLAGTFEDPGSEGNDCGTSRSAAITAAVTNGTFPLENAAYVVLPSTPTLSVAGTWDCHSGPCNAFNGVDSVGSTSYVSVGACRSTVNNNPSFPGGPTPDLYFDGLMNTAHFELMGGIASAAHIWERADGVYAFGEIHELCGGFSTSPAGIYFAANGGLANYSWTDGAAHYDAMLEAVWQYGQGGSCVVTQWPEFFTTPCRSNADCPAFSAVCDPASGHCAPPTCRDNVQNDNELGVDVGGWCSLPSGAGGVPNGGPCQTSADCVGNGSANNCMGGTCRAFAFCSSSSCPDASQFCPGSPTFVCKQRQPCNALSDCVQAYAPQTGASAYTSCTACAAGCTPTSGFTGYCN